MLISAISFINVNTQHVVPVNSSDCPILTDCKDAIEGTVDKKAVIRIH